MPKPTCAKCEAEVTEDMFCYGCKSYVCEACDAEVAWSIADAGMGGHSLEDHFIDADDE